MPDSRRLNDISFIVKNPLMYDLVPASTDQPLLIEGPSHADMTTVYALKVRYPSKNVLIFT